MKRFLGESFGGVERPSLVERVALEFHHYSTRENKVNERLLVIFKVFPFAFIQENLWSVF